MPKHNPFNQVLPGERFSAIMVLLFQIIPFIYFYYSDIQAEGSKKPAGKKDAVPPPQRNGTPGALPPIQDNTKLKEEANMYKKKAGEQEQKLVQY